MASTTDPAALLSLLSALQSQVATLSAAVAAAPAKSAAAPAKRAQKAKKEAAPVPAAAADAAAPSAEKREVPAALRGNVERINAVLSDMKKDGWPAFTDAVGKPYPGSKRSEEAGGAWVREDNGKLPNYPLAMVYASFLRCRDDPAEMAKARAYREKVAKMQAEKRSAGSASVSSSEAGGAAAEKPVSKRGAAQKERWAKMSEEERAAEKAKLKDRLAAGKAKKAGGAVAEAKPATSAAAAAEAVEEEDAFADAPAAEEDDETFVRWTHDGERYYKNALNHVLSNDTEWVGIWDGTVIQDAEPPAYLDGGDVKIVEDEEDA
jgi:hypothetical protein